MHRAATLWGTCTNKIWKKYGTHQILKRSAIPLEPGIDAKEQRAAYAVTTDSIHCLEPLFKLREEEKMRHKSSNNDDKQERKTVRIAIAGVGNCASSLVQGLGYYSDVMGHPFDGLMHPEIGGLRCSDIEVVAAFDVDSRKVGKPLSEAIFEEPNCAVVFHRGETKKIPVVFKGPTLDGIAPHMATYPPSQSFLESNAPSVDVASALRSAGAEVLVNYMPVGADMATRYYAQACLDAGCAMVNCTPSFIASNPSWAERFTRARLPIIGDDIKSQVGATIVHRTIARLLGDRGMRLMRTYQLNVGGNTDFLNMLARDRLASKKISKTNSVRSQAAGELADDDIAIGPSDYVPWQKDGKIAFIRLEAEGFGGAKMDLEMRLSVQDSPNSAGIVIDAIRLAALGLRKGQCGPLEVASAWLMKSPPHQMRDEDARRALEDELLN